MEGFSFYLQLLWLPHHRKDAGALERVQWRFTRMMPRLEGYSYRERLDSLGQSPLHCQRLGGFLIEVDNILGGVDSQGGSPTLEGIAILYEGERSM